MGEKTAIEWTESTWNPWYGCRKVSQGCKHCYAERDMKYYALDFRTVQRAKGFDVPLKWKEPRMIFTCSWSDFFIEDADPWRAEAWRIIHQTPHHTYQILTKRPERIAECLPANWGDGWPNVWLGTSVENQAAAQSRILHLVRVPVRVRFLSCEPLLGPLTLELMHPDPHDGFWAFDPMEHIHWVIAGGESGPNFRPMDMAWARELRDQCFANGVPFFFKQHSGLRPGQRAFIVEEDGTQTTWQEMPEVERGDPPPSPSQLSLFDED